MDACGGRKGDLGSDLIVWESKNVDFGDTTALKEALLLPDVVCS
jgi:hypothetical protein